MARREINKRQRYFLAFLRTDFCGVICCISDGIILFPRFVAASLECLVFYRCWHVIFPGVYGGDVVQGINISVVGFV